MAIEPEPLLTAVGVIVVAAYAALWVFRRLRLPDVLLLIALGVVIGPIMNWVEIELFRAVAPLVSIVAVIIILFDGGLEMQLGHLKTGVAGGALLALFVFSLTALLCILPAHLIGGYSLVNSLLLGMAFGGAGVVIVIPLIRHLDVKPESVTLVSIEAAISDVLVIVGIYAVSTAIVTNRTNPADFGSALATTFAVGLSVGFLAGFLWARALGREWFAGYEYVLTLGVLFLVHAASETLGGSGPIAILTFGLVVGNSKKTKAFVAESRIAAARRASETPEKRTKSGRTILVPVFGDHLTGFHREIVFLIRAFFFVGLGVTLELAVFQNPRFLVLGIILTAMVGIGRYVGVRMIARRDRFPVWDRTAIALMFPLGLAAAALSQVPSQRFGIEGTDEFGAVATVVIVLTNVATTFLVWWLSRPKVRAKMEERATAGAPV